MPIGIDSVVVAEVTAQVIPGDPHERLYIPLRSGEATLYWQGTSLPGTWTRAGGFRFQVYDGEDVVLMNRRHWVPFVPNLEDVATE